jgi:hypothetical protein
VIGWWRKMHKDELRYFYSLSSIIRIMKLRKLRWTGNTAQMGRMETLVGFGMKAREKEASRMTKTQVGGLR